MVSDSLQSVIENKSVVCDVIDRTFNSSEISVLAGIAIPQT